MPSDIRANILIAYPYFSESITRSLQNWDHKQYRLMVDSGAFTAWKSGTPIQLDDYCRFLDSIECLRPFNAIQLDVLRNHEKTRENYLTMKARGYDVLPVFTRGAPIEWLHEASEHSDYILFGGIVEGKGNRGYVEWFHQNLKKNIRVHWLGFDNREYVLHYKPHSMDSSSWLSAAQYGIVPIYAGRNTLRRFTRQDIRLRYNEACAAMRRIKIPEEWQRHFTEDEHNAWRDSDLDTTMTAIKVSAWSFLLRNYEIESKIGTVGYMALARADKLRLLKQILERMRQTL